MISSWMTIRSLAAYLKAQNEKTMIGENSLRTLISMGLPHLRIGNRVLINVDTFEEELMKFTFRQRRKAMNS